MSKGFYPMEKDMRAAVLVVAVIAHGIGGCCVYQEDATRRAFRELSEDATDLKESVGRCIADATANKAVCDAVIASLAGLATEADQRAKLGQEQEAKP
jgi:hypothetical protein